MQHDPLAPSPGATTPPQPGLAAVSVALTVGTVPPLVRADRGRSLDPPGSVVLRVGVPLGAEGEDGRAVARLTVTGPPAAVARLVDAMAAAVAAVEGPGQGGA
jgi:hypothetical protein